jgi:hypothetical protein
VTLLHRLLPQVTNLADRLMDSGQISKLVLDTHDRELERYADRWEPKLASTSSTPTAAQCSNFSLSPNRQLDLI